MFALKTGATYHIRQVLWQEDDLAKNLNLVSVSGDGTVAGWTVVKNVLVHTVRGAFLLSYHNIYMYLMKQCLFGKIYAPPCWLLYFLFGEDSDYSVRD